MPSSTDPESGQAVRPEVGSSLRHGGHPLAINQQVEVPARSLPSAWHGTVPVVADHDL